MGHGMPSHTSGAVVTCELAIYLAYLLHAIWPLPERTFERNAH